MTSLPSTCLSVPGCDRQRLTYAGYCDRHGPKGAAVPEPRCVAPLRCYCPSHLGRPRMLGPDHGPESIRLMLDELAARRARRAGALSSVIPAPSR